MSAVIYTGDGIPFGALHMHSRGNAAMTVLIAAAPYKRSRDDLLDDFHRCVADIGRLAMSYAGDAQERGERRARDLVALDRRDAPVAPKPIVARVTGLDIRRFIPRRV